MSNRNSAIIIGAGFGGLSLGIRLQSLGFDTTIVEKLDKAGVEVESFGDSNGKVEELDAPVTL